MLRTLFPVVLSCALLVPAASAAPLVAAATNGAAGQPPPADVIDAPTGRFGWPLAGLPAVLRPFEAPAHRYGPGHRGVDLAGAPGRPVLAAGDGTVVFAGPVAGRPVVSVQHAGGLRTTYEPVLAEVTAGAVVVRGGRIGVLQAGHPGCAAAACLHWGARRGPDYLDPLLLLAPPRLRLLPWDGTR